jgi:hypothetical protein
VIALGDQRAVSGREVEFGFTIRPNGLEVGAFQFRILLTRPDRVLVYEPVTINNDLLCRLSSDLDADFEITGVMRADNGDAIISVFPDLLGSPIVPRDGIFAQCRFRVAAVAPDRYPLLCDPAPLAATSSDPDGNDLPTRCDDGGITVRAASPCPGDCDRAGGVTIVELVRGVSILLGAADVRTCAALDLDRDGRGTVDELLSAVDVALDGCE